MKLLKAIESIVRLSLQILTGMSTPSPSPSPPLVPPRPFSFYNAVMKGSAAKPPRATKRERSLYTYNFSPPSTPRGNHTVHADKAEVAIETVFTPRCTMQRGIQCQKDAVQAAVTVTDSQWHAYASMLSPPPSKCKYPPLDRPPCPFVNPIKQPCLCFLCAGFKAAKPKTTPCVVCGALIPYSICDKQLCATLPVLCFLCKCVFTD